MRHLPLALTIAALLTACQPGAQQPAPDPGKPTASATAFAFD